MKNKFCSITRIIFLPDFGRLQPPISGDPTRSSSISNAINQHFVSLCKEAHVISYGQNGEQKIWKKVEIDTLDIFLHGWFLSLRQPQPAQKLDYPPIWCKSRKFMCCYNSSYIAMIHVYYCMSFTSKLIVQKIELSKIIGIAHIFTFLFTPITAGCFLIFSPIFATMKWETLDQGSCLTFHDTCKYNDSVISMYWYWCINATKEKVSNSDTGPLVEGLGASANQLLF